MTEEEYEFVHEMTNKLTMIEGKIKRISVKNDNNEDIQKILNWSREAIQCLEKYKKHLYQEDC